MTDERALAERRILASLADAKRTASIFGAQDYLLAALRAEVAMIEAVILEDPAALPVEPEAGDAFRSLTGCDGS